MTMVQVPEGTEVSTQGHADQRRPFKLSSGCLRFVNLIIIFLLDLANLKTLLACSILWGCERQIF